MEEEKQKITQDDLTRWLTSFETATKQSVVVSLLIEEGKIYFVSCVSKNYYLDTKSEGEIEEPGIELHKMHSKVGANAGNLDLKQYTG